MSLPPSDRRLRRLVAEIAAAPPADVEDILDRLEPGARDAARQLLARYLGAVDAPPAPGLSPWLAQRLGHPRPPKSVPIKAFVMTPHAVSALKAAAAAAPRAHVRFEDLASPLRSPGGRR
jgi:hypothetical protein